MNLEFCVFVKLNTFLGLLAKINCFENLDSKKTIDFTERKFSWNLGLFQWTLDEVAVGILSFILILFVHLSSPVNLIIIITIEGLPHLSGFWFAKSNLLYIEFIYLFCVTICKWTRSAAYEGMVGSCSWNLVWITGSFVQKAYGKCVFKIYKMGK